MQNVTFTLSEKFRVNPILISVNNERKWLFRKSRSFTLTEGNHSVKARSFFPYHKEQFEITVSANEDTIVQLAHNDAPTYGTFVVIGVCLLIMLDVIFFDFMPNMFCMVALWGTLFANLLGWFWFRRAAFNIVEQL